MSALLWAFFLLFVVCVVALIRIDHSRHGVTRSSTLSEVTFLLVVGVAIGVWLQLWVSEWTR